MYIEFYCNWCLYHIYCFFR